MLVDYDHQTMTAPNTGAKAPAAGWITQLEWVDGQGLFAQVDWTANAKTFIQGQEYRYFSPVIQYDDDTGEVTNVLMGALVNFPGLQGMQAVDAALAAQFATPVTPSSETLNMTLLATLLARIGLPADTTEAALVAAVGDLKTAADAAKTRPAVPAALAGALGVAATADEAAALAAVVALNTKAATASAGFSGAALEQITALQAQVGALQTAANEAAVAALADQAVAEGKFVPSFHAELLKIGRGNLAALKSMVAAAPVIPGLAGQSSAAAAAAAGQPGAGSAVAALSSADALVVARNMGIKPEDWAAGAKTAAAAH
jgi:phage I-like protein